MIRMLAILVPVAWFAAGVWVYDFELGALWMLCSFIAGASVFLILHARAGHLAHFSTLVAVSVTPICVTVALGLFAPPSAMVCDDPPCQMVLTIPAPDANAGSGAGR